MRPDYRDIYTHLTLFKYNLVKVHANFFFFFIVHVLEPNNKWLRSAAYFLMMEGTSDFVGALCSLIGGESLWFTDEDSKDQ